jgi:hypothetical protein
MKTAKRIREAGRPYDDPAHSGKSADTPIPENARIPLNETETPLSVVQV